MPISEGPHKGRAGWMQDGQAVTFCYFTRRVVPIEQADRNRQEYMDMVAARDKPSRPHVISDYLPDLLLHPSTGKRTDSKSLFRRMTRDTGCIEVGDQAPTANKLPSVTGSKADRVNALKEAFNRHGVSVL